MRKMATAARFHQAHHWRFPASIPGAVLRLNHTWIRLRTTARPWLQAAALLSACRMRGSPAPATGIRRSTAWLEGGNLAVLPPDLASGPWLGPCWGP